MLNFDAAKPFSGKRIIILGAAGSGKTTLSRQLAQKLGVPHVELDALFWEPNWTEASLEVFRERVVVALNRESWVVDGNYSKVRDICYRQADTIIWLNYSFPLTFSRLLRRTIHRILWRKELWSGNRESIRNTFFSRDSLIVWLFKNYWKKRREYPIVFKKPEYTHLRVLEFQSPRQTEHWLSSIEANIEASITKIKERKDAN